LFRKILELVKKLFKQKLETSTTQASSSVLILLRCEEVTEMKVRVTIL